MSILAGCLFYIRTGKSAYLKLCFYSWSRYTKAFVLFWHWINLSELVTVSIVLSRRLVVGSARGKCTRRSPARPCGRVTKRLIDYALRLLQLKSMFFDNSTSGLGQSAFLTAETPAPWHLESCTEDQTFVSWKLRLWGAVNAQTEGTEEAFYII